MLNSLVDYTTIPVYPEEVVITADSKGTSHELNGWGDDIVHDDLRAVEHRGRVGVLYSNKDYGCEWDYDGQNKRFQREDNTQFAVRRWQFRNYGSCCKNWKLRTANCALRPYFRSEVPGK